MKKKPYSFRSPLLLTCYIFIAMLLSACVGNSGPVLSSYPDTKVASVNYPNVPFNSKEARAALQKGTATINGMVCIVGDVIQSSNGLRVSLYPVTPHLLEWQKLRASKPKNAYVSMLPEAVAMRLDAVTKNDGKFIFNEMRPGKYFLQVAGSAQHTTNRDVYVGSGYTNTAFGVATTNYYRTDSTNSYNNVVLEDLIELKEGETKRITMKNKGYVLGCHLWM